MKPYETSYRPEEKLTYFGVAMDDRYVQRFALMFSDGRRISIPYAVLPLIMLDAQARLHIVSRDFHVTITGKNLALLSDYLDRGLVTWIKEKTSPFNKKEEDEFEVIIDKLDISSELLI